MERMLSFTANALSDKYDVSVVTAFNEDRPDHFAFAAGVHRHDLGIKRGDFPKPAEIKEEYRKRLSEWLTANRQDTAVSLGSLEMFFLPDIKDGSKKIFWFHFAWNYDMMCAHSITPLKIANTLIGCLKRLRRIRAARRYDAMVVLTEHDRATWQHYVHNVTCIHNPVTITPLPVEDYSAERAVAVGRLDWQKGFDILIKAWSIVARKYPDWQLDICGDGPEREKLEQLAAALHLSGKVSFPGNISNMAGAYSKHSLMIMSSRYEGFGLVLVEAAACGLPLVAFDCEQGPSEIINSGQNGFLVSPAGDTDKLAEAIMQLTADEDKRRQMGTAAKEMAEEFEPDKITRQWCDLFEHIATEK